MSNSKILISLAAAVLLCACESEPLENLQQSIVETTPTTDGDINPTALFDPNNAVIPFPNGLLLSGSTDGTLNIPVADANDLSDPQVALNATDGFSTLSPMTTGFSTAIDASSISGTSVKLYNVTLSGPGGAVVGVNSQLTFGVDYVATLSSVDSTNSTLAIVPLRPLAEKSSYMAVVTSNLSAASGSAFGPSVTLRLIKSLTDPNPLAPCSSPTDPACTLPGALRSLDAAGLAQFDALRQLVNTSESTISAFDPADNVTTSSIILSWSFTTQSVGDVLEQVRTDIRSAAVPTTALQDSTIDSPLTGQTGFVGADIFAGTLAVPYYLTAASGVNDPTPLATFWTGAGGTPLGGNMLPTPVLSPVATSTQTIPMLVSVPKSAAPGAGYPIVIFQHGITTNRATVLAIADAFANAGLAVVSIDLPLHGLTGLETDGTAGFKTSIERTFDLDLVTQDPSGSITATTPDGVIDSSGRHYINLTNLLNTRDNVRQGVSDLMALTFAIQNMNAGGATFDTSRIYFLGHSLGAMVGSTFVALESDVRDAAFAFGAAGYAKVLDGSAAFGPEIAAGLATNGVTKGTADFEAFLGAAQTVIDTADPANHAADTVTGRGVLYFEIVGGGPGQSPSDLVVPNTVPDGNDTSGTVAAPLAGTEPLLSLMGLTQVNSDQGPGTTDLLHSVKFVVGNHSSLLSAAADSFNDEATNTLVRTEIQSLAATFLASDGVFVDVTDASLLQTP